MFFSESLLLYNCIITIIILFMGFLCWFEELLQKERKERESFLGGQMDMQESKKDKQMGVKHSFLYYSRLQ